MTSEEKWQISPLYLAQTRYFLKHEGEVKYGIIMEKQDVLQSAAERLTAALDVIEQRFDIQIDEFAKNSDHEEKLDRLMDERGKLKSELNEARAQAKRLTSANQDVANRLDSVINSLKAAFGKS
ncbi:MAG: DUF4164 family protein [Pseudomonadota bacterium]